MVERRLEQRSCKQWRLLSWLRRPVVFTRRLIRYDAYLHAKQHGDLVRLATASLFPAGKQLVGCRRINAVFPGKLLNRFTLLLQPGPGLCCGADSGHSSKPFKSVRIYLDSTIRKNGVNKVMHSNEWNWCPA